MSFHSFHLPDPELSELSKLLDMKGVKRSEQSQIVELFKDQQRKSSQEDEKTGGITKTVISNCNFIILSLGLSKGASPLHSSLRTKKGLEPVKK